MKIQALFFTTSLLTNLSLAQEHLTAKAPINLGQRPVVQDCEENPDNKENHYFLRIERIYIPADFGYRSYDDTRSMSINMKVQDGDRSNPVSVFPPGRATFGIPRANQQDGSTLVTEVPAQDVYIPSSERKCGNYEMRLDVNIRGIKSSTGNWKDGNVADSDVRKHIRLKGNKSVAVSYDNGLVVVFKVVSKKIDPTKDFIETEKNLRKGNLVNNMMAVMKTGSSGIGISDSTFQGEVIKNRSIMSGLKSQIEGLKGGKGYEELVDLYNNMVSDLGEQNRIRYYSAVFHNPPELKEYKDLLIK